MKNRMILKAAATLEANGQKEAATLMRRFLKPEWLVSARDGELGGADAESLAAAADLQPGQVLEARGLISAPPVYLALRIAARRASWRFEAAAFATPAEAKRAAHAAAAPRFGDEPARPLAGDDHGEPHELAALATERGAA
ncbi:MAG: hypothetical protein AAGM38_15870 [Pseudomonadota bacterium]